ncbi:hypothetical protein AHiyo4_47150 [Arthrobacter sp. Hiyo4]|nr:hypothetical protein AHiyo4_47150 [Arthrobacter sp. Hiyo4]
MPPTTGGSTSGSRTSERRKRWPGKLPRARTRASGTPSTVHRTVLAAEVRRLNPRACNDASEVISGMNWAQLTLATMAASGSTTNRPPAAART